MPVEFETKKVPMETLGEYLSEVRRQFNWTLEEVAQKTGIYEKFLYYIEEGKYQLLPPDVYVLGFLKKLAEVYAVSADSLLDQYKKERGIVEHVARERIAPQKGWRAWFQKVTITPKLITIAGGGAIGVIAFLYIVVQVFAINKTPSLTINEPKDDAVISGTSVMVAGKTEPGVTLAINGQNVFVQSDGSFQTTIGVAPGQKELRVEAQNKFGKTNSHLISMRVEEPTVAGAETKIPSELNLSLKFAKSTRITVTQDGVKLPEETVPAGSEKNIVANDTIILTTSDAGGTQATLNGKLLGALGKTGQSITVPFNKDATALVGADSTPPAPVTPAPAPVKQTTPTPKPKPQPTTTPDPATTQTNTNTATPPTVSN